jgi:hypothetical protein
MQEQRREFDAQLMTTKLKSILEGIRSGKTKSQLHSVMRWAVDTFSDLGIVEIVVGHKRPFVLEIVYEPHEQDWGFILEHYWDVRMAHEAAEKSDRFHGVYRRRMRAPEFSAEMGRLQELSTENIRLKMKPLLQQQVVEVENNPTLLEQLKTERKEWEKKRSLYGNQIDEQEKINIKLQKKFDEQVLEIQQLNSELEAIRGIVLRR